MQFKFKELEITHQGSWIKRTFLSAHAKKTALYVVLGSVAGFVLFYATEGRQMTNIGTKDIFNSLIFGAFAGFFITNSPCAKGRC